MCQTYPFDRHVPVPRPPVVHEYAVAVRQEGTPGNVEVIRVEGTSLSIDAHWVKVLNDRDAVLVVPASLVRRITRAVSQ